jgi:hypothetical protein
LANTEVKPASRACLFRLLPIIFLAALHSCRAANDVPAIKQEKGKPVLVLPERMRFFLRNAFPEYRLPGREDMTGEWASFKETVPYAAWGDFDGDGRVDIVLILLGRERWRLVEFHQTAGGGFKEVDIERGLPGPRGEFTAGSDPREYHVFVVPAGRKLIIEGKPVEASTHQFDSVAFFSLKSPENGMHCRWLPDRGFHSTTRFNDFTD